MALRRGLVSLGAVVTAARSLPPVHPSQLRPARHRVHRRQRRQPNLRSSAKCDSTMKLPKRRISQLLRSVSVKGLWESRSRLRRLKQVQLAPTLILS